jgi:hypothetical protein
MDVFAVGMPVLFFDSFGSLALLVLWLVSSAGSLALWLCWLAHRKTVLGYRSVILEELQISGVNRARQQEYISWYTPCQISPVFWIGFDLITPWTQYVR